ncbi:MAG: protein-export chaperone SecB [Spongiibacteraceae bacterium]
MSDNQAAAAQEQQFALQRIYMKDCSFEAPLGAKAFTKQWQPQVSVDLNTAAERVEGDNFEVVLTITITAKLGEETAFLIEIHQAGIFHIKGLDGEQLRRVLMIVCPNILFPYAREAVDSLAIRGSFPPMSLQPVNFEAVYLQSQQQAAQH